MAVGNLLSGFLQGYSNARNQKLEREAKQDFIKLQTKQYQKKLEEQEQQQQALKKLQGLLTPQPDPSIGGAGVSTRPPKKSLMDMLVDPELQALGLASGKMDIGDLMKMQGQQQTQSMFDRFLGGDENGSPSGYGKPTVGIDAQGRMTLSLTPDKPQTIEQSVAGQSMVDASQSATIVGQWLTDGSSDIGGEGFAESISMPKLAMLATRTGEGAQMYDDLIRAVMNIVYVKSGKQITESEAERTIGPMIPQMSDVAAMFNLFDKGDLVSTERLKSNAAAKLKSLKSLIDGTMAAEEIQKMLKARGIDIKGMKTPPKLSPETEVKAQPLPGVIDWNDYGTQ